MLYLVQDNKLLPFPSYTKYSGQRLLCITPAHRAYLISFDPGKPMGDHNVGLYDSGYGKPVSKVVYEKAYWATVLDVWDTVEDAMRSEWISALEWQKSLSGDTRKGKKKK